MCEGRRSQVVLLDERRLDLFVQPKLFAGELLDLVASHFHLKEKEYFGIAYLNESGQFSWLQLDKRVLEHDFPKKGSSSNGNSPQLTFYFRVKYFVESITQLRDSATVEAFYLQAKSLLAKGELEAENDTVFQLAALVLQATYGDYVDESMFKSQLRRLPILPTATLKDSFSITSCEDKVLNHYKTLTGQSRGDAIVNYLTIVESLPTYGQHYYEVKDKSGSQCRLGLNYKGISQYEKSDRHTPTRVFLWKQLENLYFRDKKFTIEVHEVRRVVHTLSSFNLYEDAIEEPIEEYDDLSDAICDPTTQVSVSRRTLAPANVTVYVWYASSPVVTKCIWSMAIAQHHFFLDRKHQKNQVKLAPCLNQIASELCRSVQSLSSAGSQSNISRSTSSSSLPSTILGGELSEESKAATIEMLTALQSRKDALEEALRKKNEELKALCLKEGEITGEIPPEIPLLPGEACPQVRRRVGTSFCLSDKWIKKTRSNEKEALNDLELEYEIQSKIASAAYQLANDCTARKSVRKQRKMSYAQAAAKLRSLELKLRALQKEKRIEKEGKENDGSESSSISSNDKASRINLNVDSISSHSESGTLMSSAHSITSIPPCGSLPQLTVTAPSEGSGSCRQRHQSLQHVPFSNDGAAWAPSSYCSSMEFDTISCGNDSVKTLPLRSPYKNRFESRLDIEGSNLYSVPNRRASQVFDSQDDLLLSGRKSDYDKRSPLKNIPVDPQNHYSNTLPLSSSYDERMWCTKPKELIASSESSSLETSFDTHSNAGYFDATCLKQTLAEPPKNSMKLQHFSSTEHLDNGIHTSEQDSRPLKMTHVRSVPHLHEKVSSSHDHSLLINSASASHSLNQVAELVNASMLRQGGKRSTTLLHSRGCLSPKSKTKEWIETSLDSPTVIRRNKPKISCNSKKNIQENIYENHPIALSPFAKDNFLGSTSEDYVNVRSKHLTMSPSQFANDEWTGIPVSTTPLHFAPIEQASVVDDEDDSHIDSVSSYLPQDETLYEEYHQNENHNILNDQLHPFVMTLQHTYPHKSNVQQVIQYPNFDYQQGCLSPEVHDEKIPDVQSNRTTISTCQAAPQVASPQCNISVCSSNGTILNDTVQFNDTTLVEVPQEVVEPLSPSSGQNFPFPTPVEINVVSVGQFQPYWEETKPYELSDFYKYSTKHRKSQTEAPVEKNDSPSIFGDLKEEVVIKGPVFSSRCESLMQKPPSHREIVMNAHIAVLGHADYQHIGYGSLFNNESPRSPVPIQSNSSFGEAGIQVSVADSFHDEMLAWYENRDSVKKVTLV